MTLYASLAIPSLFAPQATDSTVAAAGWGATMTFIAFLIIGEHLSDTSSSFWAPIIAGIAASVFIGISTGLTFIYPHWIEWWFENIMSRITTIVLLGLLTLFSMKNPPPSEEDRRFLKYY